MTPKFTPSPWTAKPSRHAGAYMVITDAFNRPVADVLPRLDEQPHANAMLIVLAPEMFDALAGVINAERARTPATAGNWHVILTDDQIQAIEALLDKAGG